MRSYKKIVVKGLPPKVRAKEIYDMIGGAFTPAKVFVSNPKAGSGYNTAMCFIELKEETDTAVALDFFKAQEGLRAHVAFDHPAKLYIGNLPFPMTKDQMEGLEDSLRDEFNTELQLMIPFSNKGCRGFGFVNMEQEDAERVLSEEIKLEFIGRPLRISWAVPKDKAKGVKSGKQ